MVLYICMSSRCVHVRGIALTAHDQDNKVVKQIVVCICTQRDHQVLGVNIVVICICAQQGHRVLGDNLVVNKVTEC